MDGNMSSVANQSGTSSMMGELLLLSRIWCIVYIVESVSTSSISEYLNSIFACLVIVIVSVYCFAKVKVGEAITTYSHLYLVLVKHLFSLVCFGSSFEQILMHYWWEHVHSVSVSISSRKIDSVASSAIKKSFASSARAKVEQHILCIPCLHLFHCQHLQQRMINLY